MEERKKKVFILIFAVVFIFILVDYVNWRLSHNWEIVDTNLPVETINSTVWRSASIDILDPIKSPPKSYEYSNLRIAAFKVRYPKAKGGGYVHEVFLREWFKRSNLKVRYTGFEGIPDFYIAVEFIQGRMEIISDSKLYNYKGEIFIELFSNNKNLLAQKRIKVNINNKPPEVKELTGL